MKPQERKERKYIALTGIYSKKNNHSSHLKIFVQKEII